jgi:hypothetical protein
MKNPKTPKKRGDARKELDQRVKEARVRYGVPIGEVMRPRHPWWTPFYNRLAGPEFCDFHCERKGDPESFRFRCEGGRNKTFARQILQEMGFSKGQIEVSCTYFESRGGFCDCEIIWNVRPRRVGRKPRRKP